ncbi:MAG: hypothetical protein KJP00_14785 [Bacteroidia bacterium]|nr:hypothetical protein [Bacteroidia bacterium]
MATRTKITPLAKFIIMLIVVSPLAYLGASYYNGEDGLQNIREFISKKENVETANENLQEKSKKELIETIELMEMKIDQLEQRIEQLENAQ